MQFKLHLDADHPVVIVQYTGVVTVDTILESMESINKLPDIKPGTHTLSDFRLCTELQLKTNDLVKIGNVVQVIFAWRGDYKVAHLVNSKAHYGVSRMASIIFQKRDEDVQVFEDEASALKWLDISSDYAWPF